MRVERAGAESLEAAQQVVLAGGIACRLQDDIAVQCIGGIAPEPVVANGAVQVMLLLLRIGEQQDGGDLQVLEAIQMGQ